MQPATAFQFTIQICLRIRWYVFFSNSDLNLIPYCMKNLLPLPNPLSGNLQSLSGFKRITTSFHPRGVAGGLETHSLMEDVGF